MTRTKTAIAIAIFLTFIMIAPMAMVNAHVPAWNIPTYSFIVVSPNPVGTGQTLNVNFWVNIPPPTANAQYGDRWGNVTVKVTKPDGTTQTLGPFITDDTGGTFTTFTPTALGNYTFQMFFAGQVLAGNNLAPGQTSPFIGDYFQPSQSNTFSVTVQEEPITYPGVTPLPTQYWTRPVYGENNEWYSVSGNWLGLAASTFAATGMYNASGNYNPYTKAPNTAHILWTKPEAFGGIIGGEYGNTETANYYSTSQYEPKFAPIIMQGILYYTMYPGSSTYPQGWAAVDLHTGQTLWTKDVKTEVLRCGQILNMITPNQYGALAYLWTIPIAAAGFQASGQYMSMYDAMTGDWILNVTGTPSMTLTHDENGNLIGYFVNSTDPTAPTLNMWNSTRCINIGSGGSPAGGYPSGLADNWMWRPLKGAQINFTFGIQWSVPIAANYSGNPLPGRALGISGVNSGVVFMTVYPNVGVTQYEAGYIIVAGYSAKDGSQLWITNRTETVAARILYGGPSLGSGVQVEFDSSALTATGYSLNTGNKLWGPIALPNVSPYSSLGMQYVTANGTIYMWTYGGDVYAFNILTGAILWQYHSRPADLESPYGIWPLWTFTVGTVADGKLFVPEGHMYSPPLFHEAQQLALNITDGSLVWSIDAFDVTSAPAVSDGVMVTLNAYDNQIYSYGKGPSRVTVTAPNAGVTTSAPIMISGTVTDISAGSQQEAVAANFPDGLPCVSDASMTDWMKFVYMQQPCPTDVTGVPVTIDVIDANNNYRNIGTATSDGEGFFSFEWTPDIPGRFTVIATFAGSEGYWPSNAEAAFVAAEAPGPTVAPTNPPGSIADQYFLPMSIATIIAVIVAAIAIILVLRKR
jgi:PQQ-like domain